MLQTVTSLPNRQCPAQGLFFSTGACNSLCDSSEPQWVPNLSTYMNHIINPTIYIYICIYVHTSFMKYHFQNMVRLGFHFVLVGPGFQDQVVVVVLVSRTLLFFLLLVGFVLQGSLTTGPGFQDQVVAVGPGFQDRLLSLLLLLLVLVCRTWLLVSVVGGGPVLQDSLITIGSGFQDMVVGFHFVLVGPGFWDIVVVGPGPTC